VAIQMTQRAVVAIVKTCGRTPQGSSVAVPIVSTVRSSGVVTSSCVMMPDQAVVTAMKSTPSCARTRASERRSGG
jgi:hypothetical protein